MTDSPPLIVVAGASGDLGARIAREIMNRGGRLRALVRQSTPRSKTRPLRDQGAEIRVTNFDDVVELTDACRGATCVLSALSGLEDVIVGVQTRLLEAAEAAGAPRFIPSDFALDFTQLPRGTNRNLDFRKTFQERLEQSPLAVTSILNGMFADLLNGQAPFIVDRIHRVLYYGDDHQQMDFTTMDDTARYTALAAMDADTPRYLRIAGDVLDAHGLARAAEAARGGKYRPLRIGGIGVLTTLIGVTRLFVPGRDDTYPAWQGMQYMRNMMSGRGKLSPLDNHRYPDFKWTPVREVLARATE
ncbi:NmrA family NAD(P)-binding protein [Neolewinella litorea]|uniref:NmrA family protein n=1 Tax=Neolewinella litorea TaxID=2562452 RepID=A0A4S4NZ52_9BACT|nr:NmrA family NAD(P)-binding protein [Neolewinella litorea]THH41570.1 NmrA family protein [Neolewinella litorea]